MRSLAVLIAALVLSATPLAAAEFAVPVGHYVMQKVHGENVPLATLKDPRLTGFHVRDEWQLVETRDGQFNWSWFDAQLAKAAKIGKHVTLGTYSGNNSPTWLDAARVDNVPIPWNPIVTSNWSDYVAAFGSRYNANPLIDAVHVSGPATDASMEMHYPTGLAKVAGYSDAKVIKTWTDSIDAFAAAFPSKTLILDIAPVPNYNNPTVMNAVIAHMRATVGDRAAYEHNSLKASTQETAKHHATIVALGAAGERIGFEFVGPSIDRERFGGTFATALAKGEKAGATFYQVYHQDVQYLPKAAATGSAGVRGTVVPEPPSMWLATLAVKGIFLMGLRRRHCR